MAGLRRTFGIAEPVRRGMELKIAREGEWRPGCLGGSAGVSGDVLEGRDERIEWEDVYCGMFCFVFWFGLGVILFSLFPFFPFSLFPPSDWFGLVFWIRYHIAG